MRRSMSTSRVARSLAAFALVTAVAAAFAVLGGIDLAHSMIRLEQYGEVQDISIDKATAAKNGSIAVTVTIVGWKMYPKLLGKPFRLDDGGHWVMMVDTRCNNVSTNKSKGSTKPLKSGKHKLRAQLAFSDGRYPGILSDSVSVKTKLPAGKKPGVASTYCAKRAASGR